jgi:small conductance mechanosensitive channel
MDLQQRFSDLSEKLLDKVVDWVEGFVRMLPNLLIAVTVLLLSWAIARVVCKFIDRQLERHSRQHQLRHFIVRVVRLGVIVGGCVVALGILNLDKTVTSILAGVGIVGLALGFAFQDIAANFMAGILMIFRKPFQTGDLVESSDFFGRIEKINMRDTVGRTPQGLLVIIPNRLLIDNLLTNYNGNEHRRIDLACGVAYGDDLEQAEKIAIEAVERIGERISEQPVELFYEEFGDSSINFKIRFWVQAEQKIYLAARSKAIKTIKAAFDANGITIPFPIRTLDFGVVGGEPLRDHLKKIRETKGD